MIGGAGTHDDFATAMSAHRSDFERNLLSTMRSLGFSGLDLDLEPINDGDQQPFIALVSDLRSAMPSIVLSVPVAWVSINFPDVPAFYGQLAQKVDRINVMSYGMAGPWDGWQTWHSSALDGAGSSTPSSIAINVQSYTNAGVPADKLGVGIGFYGTCWAGGVTGPRQDIGKSTIAADDNVMSYTNIMAKYFDPSAYHYDNAAQAPYLSFPSGKGPQNCTFVSYENSDSISAKGAWAVSHGLGGAIVWTIPEAHVLGQPAGQGDPLLKATKAAFQA
jgi:chitinase